MIRAPLATYYALSAKHRTEHGCGGHPYENGQELTQLAEQQKAKEILELGTAVGFSAYCFAQSMYEPHIDTLDNDTLHVQIARELLQANGIGDRVSVIEGNFVDVLSSLDKAYDLIFFDGFEPDISLIQRLDALAKNDAVIVTANLSWSSTAQEYLDTLEGLGWEHEKRRDIAISRRRK